MKQIGRELNVRYVLEGSVQRSGNRMRVNVQLIDAETGNHLWADRFDKPVADLFDMQDEIVARLANQLGAELTGAEAHRAERTQTPNSMDHYFQGLAWLNRGINPENMKQARGYFQRALGLDPDNLDALLGAGQVDFVVAANFLSDDRAARLTSAEATIAKVLSLRPNDPLAHEIMGGVLNQTKRAIQGIAEFERALALDPNRATAHGEIGLAKIFVGRAEETEAHESAAMRLSPRDSFAWLWLQFAGGASAPTRTRSRGSAVASNSTGITPLSISFSPPRSGISACSTRRRPRPRSDWCSTRRSQSSVSASASRATIRSSSSIAKTSMKACARPECRRGRHPPRDGVRGLLRRLLSDRGPHGRN